MSAYRLNQVDPNPLMVASRLPLPTPATPSHDQEEEDNDATSRAKRCKLASEETFGKNALPTIENFTFKVHGTRHSVPCREVVLFRASSGTIEFK